jgi:hypothetical protein
MRQRYAVMAAHRAATPPTAPPTITPRFTLCLEGPGVTAGTPVDGETEAVDVALCDDV